MTTKHYCDGCDKQVDDNCAFVLSFQTHKEMADAFVKSNGAGMCGEWKNLHLCDGCARHMRSNIDPHRWPRSAPEDKDAAA